ncbi:FCD domain-containing protein [Rhodobacteraceae bacterium 2CG4]|uniref:FCD domain-containing protein n=1 Tax=Halovulum marinum TaxID=2662447 RepID=A0A6L5YWZ9_9RHOB|nr:FCD domain-containing protein [Halovulum marinum]MSU88866.1 FCD domain-containing protein [Halovulum marinum]
MAQHSEHDLAHPAGLEDEVPGDSRAADAVVSALEAEILSGTLPDGRPLPAERDLIQRFGASRTVIREAIIMMSARGMLQSRPRHRPIVKRPDYRTAVDSIGGIIRHLLVDSTDVRNLFDTRIFIERGLVRDAALSATKADIEMLAAALEANRAAIDDSEDFYRTDTEFHGVLYRMTRNPVFPAVHAAYAAWLSPHWLRMQRYPERNRVNYGSHKAIFDAIVERDPEAAERALTDHLRSAWEYVRVTFDSAR